MPKRRHTRRRRTGLLDGAELASVGVPMLSTSNSRNLFELHVADDLQLPIKIRRTTIDDDQY